MKSIWKVLVLSLLAWMLGGGRLSASASDSIDIQHIHIRIDTLDVANQSLRGHTTLWMTPKVANLGTLTLDLLMLSVDSIHVNGVPSAWVYNDTLLRVNPAGLFQPSDTLQVDVWYHGAPKRDNSGFGGFYFNSTYVYNIGVGLSALPPNFGRVWFPCKDNFFEKSTYEFSIRVLAGKMAVCNGTLTGEVDNGDGTHTFHWDFQEPIPSYLASMAVAPYVCIRDTFVSLTGDSIPSAIYVVASDSLDALGSFPKLEQAFSGFESKFGPYPFERVGFVAVPFNGGAMEHASNIAYPVFAVNGNLTYETLWAHEFSHSWFGDQITTTDAAEMWINEGWASYCEAVFTEIAYGAAAYKNYVRANHADVLRRTHIQDGGYFAVSGVPSDLTYSNTVYKKGASMVHGIRYQMGTTPFFDGVKSYLSGIGWGNANTDTLRNQLEAASGQNLQGYFDGFISQPGFVHFEVDSFSATPPGGTSLVQVFMRQRTKEAGLPAQNIRIPLRALGAGGEVWDTVVVMSGALQNFTFSLPFQPTRMLCDPEEWIPDATTDQYGVVHADGVVNFASTYANISVTGLTDSLLLRVTHHWIAPDSTPVDPNGHFALNTSRYWELETGFSGSANLVGTLTYNGRPGSNVNNYLDNDWIPAREDSILLVYRSGPGDMWREAVGYVVNMGSLTDLQGSVTVNNMVAGQYALATRLQVVGRGEALPGPEFQVSPNPSRGRVRVEWTTPGDYALEVVDLNGKVVISIQVEGKSRHTDLNLSGLPAGQYFVRLSSGKGTSASRPLIVQP